MGSSLWLGDVLGPWLFGESLPFFVVQAVHPEVFVSTGSNWASICLLAGRIGRSFDHSAVVDQFVFAMFFEVVLLIPGPCWGRLLSGERMDFNSLRLPQASRMLISGAYVA